MRERVLAMAKAVDMRGAVRRKVKIAEGAARARSGRSALERVDFEALLGVMMRRVER